MVKYVVTPAFILLQGGRRNIMFHNVKTTKLIL